jgi:Bacterial sugar transferase
VWIIRLLAPGHGEYSVLEHWAAPARTAEEAALYGDDVRRRLVVKPGITGLWQVNGRSDLSWDESVRLDLRYLENSSKWRTPPCAWP